MTLNEYQKLTNTTAIYPKEQGVNYCILGLNGESGELCNKYKKVIRDNKGILSEEKRIDLIKETGDCLWYISQLCSELGISLEDVAKSNIDKLLDRKERNVIGGSGDNR